jgi:hypothetical protein
MSDNLTTGIVSIVIAIIGLASLSVILSKNANTAGVLQAASGGLSTDIQAATGPVTGGLGGLGSLAAPSLSNGLG